MRLGLDAYPVLSNPPIKVDKDVQKEIGNKLASKYSPPSWKLIFENGRGFHRRGNYRMAVVEVYSGFESFLIDFVRSKYEEKRYGERLINHLMHLKDVNFMLTKGLELSLGKSFKDIDGDLWDKWIKKDGVQALRREIVHRNLTLVIKEESENAIKVINEMIKKISDEE